MNFHSKKVMIFGMARSGLSAARLMNEVGAIVYVHDSDTAVLMRAAEELPFSIPVGNKNFCGMDAIVISPGVPSASPELLDAQLNGTEVLSELELGYRFSRAEHVAVTGTNGKTTVVNLIHEILKQEGRKTELLGNVGTPFCSAATTMTEDYVAVLEVSSFQLERIRYFSPEIAVLLNLAPDHLDRYGSFVDYIATKARIFQNQSASDYAVLNADDEKIAELAKNITARRITFSATHTADACIENGFLCWQGERIIAEDELFSQLAHNKENSLAAIAAAKLLDIHTSNVAAALKNFVPPRFRVEYVGKLGNVKVFNDSKGTNIAATLAAVRSMSGSVALILGGSDKGEDFRELFSGLSESVVYVAASGANAEKIRCAATNREVKVFSELSECFSGAVFSGADVVLFSPASASFDCFLNYEERGEYFDRLFAAAAASVSC